MTVDASAYFGVLADLMNIAQAGVDAHDDAGWQDQAIPNDREIRMQILKSAMAAAMVVASSTASAALVDRGGGLIYDTVLNVTWLQDANYAKTSGRSATGSLNWDEAIAWAAGLSYVDSVRGVTYSDWRLPRTAPINGTSFNYAWNLNGASDYGYNISEQGTAFAGSTANEMAHLFYNSLDNPGLCDPVSSTPGSCVTPAAWGLVNAGPFVNFRTGAGDYYWFETDWNPQATANYAFDFSFHHGGQGGMDKGIPPSTDGMFTLLLRDGDVAAAVPEPAPLGLVVAGLAGMLGVRRWAARSVQPN